MTGFGKFIVEIPGKNISIEIKTLNSKQIDIYAKIPGFYKEKEISVRNMITKNIIRGKIEFIMHSDILNTENTPKINQDVVQNYFQQLKEISNSLGINTDPNILQTIMRLPDTLKIERNALEESEWEIIEKGIEEALKELDDFRIQEGKSLEDEFVNRIKNIETLKAEVEKYEDERLETIKTRMNQNLSEFIPEASIDKNRFEQELIYFIEKLDVTEEKVRLDNHCKYFIEVMQNEFPNGKKLGFITQEIGREINTLGSKANHTEIQKIVIRMKDELEKIKEQVLNVL